MPAKSSGSPQRRIGTRPITWSLNLSHACGAGGHVGADPARQDRVGPDAVAGVLHRQAADHRRAPRPWSRRRPGCAARRGSPRSRRSPAASRPDRRPRRASIMCLHGLAEGPEDRVQVHRGDAPPLLGGHLGEEGAPPPTPALAAHEVEPAERLHHLGDAGSPRRPRRRRRPSGPAPRRRGPCSVASALAFFSGFWPQIATLAPAAARPSAMPRPMPPLPPVTSATLPVRSKSFSHHSSPRDLSGRKWPRPFRQRPAKGVTLAGLVEVYTIT